MPSYAVNYEINPTILTVQTVCTQFLHNYFALGPLHDKEMHVLTVTVFCVIIQCIDCEGDVTTAVYFFMYVALL